MTWKIIPLLFAATAVVAAPIANADPAGLSPGQLACWMFANETPPDVMYDALVEKFSLTSHEAFGLISSADPTHTSMCSEIMY